MPITADPIIADPIIADPITDRTANSTADFRWEQALDAPTEAVLATLRTPEGISSWWAPTTGLTGGGDAETMEVASRSGSRMLTLRREPTDETGRVAWSVLTAPLTPEWVGTTLVFDVADATDDPDTTDVAGGALVRFCHVGLSPQCDCFEMCQEGWTDALARLVAFAETGRRVDDGDSFQAVKAVAASPATVLAALRTTEGIASWWGRTTGSADVGGTLEVSFLGGRQRIVMLVEPAFEHRVVWAVQEAPLTPDWAGTTIYFDVDEAAEGCTVHFRHQGLTPQLECFDMCHEGWTHYLASLVSCAETGQGQPNAED